MLKSFGLKKKRQNARENSADLAVFRQMISKEAGDKVFVYFLLGVFVAFSACLVADRVMNRQKSAAKHEKTEAEQKLQEETLKNVLLQQTQMSNFFNYDGSAQKDAKETASEAFFALQAQRKREV
jgi:hypothetical protein